MSEIDLGKNPEAKHIFIFNKQNVCMLQINCP